MISIAEFVAAFPGPIRLTYCERGEPNARAFGWLVQFSSEYFTSDSDRLAGSVDHGPEGWGATPEEALRELALQMLSRAERENRSALERALEAEENLRLRHEALAKIGLVK